MKKKTRRFEQVENNIIKSQCLECAFRKDTPRFMDCFCEQFGKCPDKYRLSSNNLKCPKRKER